MLNNLLKLWPLLFFTLPGKCGKLRTISGCYDKCYWPISVESGKSEKLVITFNRQRDSSTEVYIEICALQNGAFFCKFWPWPRFSRSSLLQVLKRSSTVESFWWRFCYSRLNNVGDIRRSFVSVFQVIHLPPWNYKLSFRLTLLTQKTQKTS